MADTTWGHNAPQNAYQNPHQTPQGYSNGYAQGYAQPQPTHASQYVHPAHGGPAPVEPQAQYGAQGYAQGYGQQHMQQNHYDQAPQMTQGAGYGAAYGAPQADPVAPAATGRFGNMANYAGAAVSLALIIGLGVWGYKLAVRDVSGIPVVRALEGPMRIQPENPGGQAAAHQGLAVNDVAAVGGATETAETVALAPGPETIEADEVLPEIATEVARADVQPAMESLQQAAINTTVTPELPQDPVAAALALAEQVAQGAVPLTGAREENEVVATLAPVVAPAAVAPAPASTVVPASVPGVRQSPRPAGRPATLNTTQVTQVSATANAAAAVAAVSGVQEVAPEQIAAGTRLVQLGAFDSPEVAKSEWDKLSIRFEDYMAGKSRVIQQAKSGGKTFYRLRALGFEDLADARRFCSVLMASKAACIPVVTR